MCCIVVHTNLHVCETSFISKTGVTIFPDRKADQQMAAATHEDQEYQTNMHRRLVCFFPSDISKAVQWLQQDVKILTCAHGEQVLHSYEAKQWQSHSFKHSMN